MAALLSSSAAAAVASTETAESVDLCISRTWNNEPLPADECYHLQIKLCALSGDILIDVKDAPFFDKNPAPAAPPGRLPQLHQFDVLELFIAGAKPAEPVAATSTTVNGQAAVAVAGKASASDVSDATTAAASSNNSKSKSNWDPYLEVQIGPYGHYHLIFFLQQAQWETQDASLEIEQLPQCSIHRSSGRWSAHIRIPSFLLPQPFTTSKQQLQQQMMSNNSSNSSSGSSGRDCEVSWRVNACVIHNSSNNSSSIDSNNNNDRSNNSDINSINQIQQQQRVHAMLCPCGGASPDFHRLDCMLLLSLREVPQLRGLIDRTQSFALERINTLQHHASNTAITTAAADANAATDAAAATGDKDSSCSDTLLSVTDESFSTAASNSNSSSSSDTSGKSAMQVAAEQLRDEFIRRMLQSVDSTTVITAADSTAADSAAATNTSATNTTTTDSSLQLPLSLQLDACFQRHVHREEFVIMHGAVTKRKGFSFKSRRLLLTSSPRLLYFNARGAYKGNIPWPVTKGFKVTKLDDKKFDISLHDNSRTYHFTVKAGSADDWVDALSQLLRAQRAYLRASLHRR